MNSKTILPYYHYGLRCTCYKEPSLRFLVIGIEKDHYTVKSNWDKMIDIPYDSKEYIPVLHSLSSLSSSLKVNQERVVPATLLCKIVQEHTDTDLSGCDPEWIVKTILRYFQNAGPCPFSRDLMNQIYYLLHVLHFDITGLIAKREALSVDKLKFDPYEFDSILL